ncbi:MAG: FtsX-like permease family protein, partial [Sphaerochaetaceae bacterium]|nr:FtsX-like permease family protein [Sphaerochaetaceae bacterium]
LGSSVADELFPYGNAIGNYISIFRNQAKSYKVVGVMEEKDPALNISFNNNIYIPFNTFSQKFSKVNKIGSYVIKVKADSDALDVEEKLKTYLNSRVTEDDYQIFSPATLAEMANQITGTFSAFLAAIAAISLLVGGIGIMNIMLVSVTERTKEIGIRKALGASPRVIMGQFITEALALTLFGGLIGIILGTLISYGVINFVSWKLYISTSSYILAVGFSTLIGVFFGWYPAYKASRLDPIDALNYE